MLIPRVRLRVYHQRGGASCGLDAFDGEPDPDLLTGEEVMPNSKTSILAVFALIVVVAGVSAAWADEVTFWNSVALDIMKEKRDPPAEGGAGSGDRAILGLRCAECDRPDILPLYYQPSVSGPASREAAVAAAAHEALVGLYPGYESSLNDSAEHPAGRHRRRSGQEQRRFAGADGRGQHAGPAGVGRLECPVRLRRQRRARQVASDAAAVSHRSGASLAQCRAVCDLQPGGLPAGAASGDDFRRICPGVQRGEVLGVKDSKVRTADQTQIAEFWNDFPGPTAAPAGKWNLIAQTLGEQQGNTLAENARMFALLNVTLADAGIVCWDTKYEYELWRPEDAIRNGRSGRQPGNAGRPGLDAAVAEPGVSGVHLGAQHVQRRQRRGSEPVLRHRRHRVRRGRRASTCCPACTRHYDSFSQAAVEAGRSRIYGGIHFEFANIAGMESGRAVADYVFDNFAHPVPVPGTSALLLFGVACLLRGRRALDRRA